MIFSFKIMQNIMSNEIVIRVNDVYKKYKNYEDKGHSLKEKLIQKKRRKYVDEWVLNGISFDVKRGEAIGLIGRNGCGKSTTLKLLTRIIYPDKGNVEINGRVSSLLELGAGFHPDLSGYENIYLNASVFGLTKKEIDERIDEIIRFSELEEFIHNPIRTYSSGMYMKLAFSVAISVDADILLIDEILGVGDVSYQKKCFEKLLEIKERGTTIVIVSHSIGQIEQICDRAIWIDEGRVRIQGETKKVNEQYLSAMEELFVNRKNKENEEREHEQLLRNEKLKKARAVIEKRKEVREKKGEKKYNPMDHEIIDKEEKEKQSNMIELANIEREKQKEIQSNFKLEEIPEDKVWEEYYKKEADRLEAVVREKNYEILRLESIIKQNEADKARILSVVQEKDEEIDRLNLIILDKDEMIDNI